MSKQKSLILLKMLMGILNFAILTFLAVIILYTIGMVRATYTARSFLNHITYLPMNPVKTVIVMYVALFTLVAIINLRQQSENSILNQTIYILEVILCGIIICCVYMEYKGIIFLVIADIVVLIRDKTSQKVFLVIMGLHYIIGDKDGFFSGTVKCLYSASAYADDGNIEFFLISECDCIYSIYDYLYEKPDKRKGAGYDFKSAACGGKCTAF